MNTKYPSRKNARQSFELALESTKGHLFFNSVVTDDSKEDVARVVVFLSGKPTVVLVLAFGCINAYVYSHFICAYVVPLTLSEEPNAAKWRESINHGFSGLLQHALVSIVVALALVAIPLSIGSLPLAKLLLLRLG